MAETRKSPSLTQEQFQTLINTDHIRRHLIKAGLINRRGEILPDYGARRQSKRRRRDLSAKYSTMPHRPLISASPPRRRRVEINDRFEPRQRSRSPNRRIGERQRHASASTARSKQTNKTATSTRLSSSTQLLAVENVLLRRKIFPQDDQCLITLKYFQPKFNIEYDREWFEPDGDEIIIMQQHCGGENLPVFKGFVKPDETLMFKSRRHSDYPFALAFYINGIINNRLSVCCEARCKEPTRIGGKRGLFGLVKVEKAKACRRCRFEQRMKEMDEAKAKAKAENAEKSKTSIVRPTTARAASSESTHSKRNDNASPNSGMHSKRDSVDNSNTTFSRRSPPKPIRTETPSPKPVAEGRLHRSPSPKSDITEDHQPSKVHSPIPMQPPTDRSSGSPLDQSRPARINTTNGSPTKPTHSSPELNRARLSTPELFDFDTSSNSDAARKISPPRERRLSSPPMNLGPSIRPRDPTPKLNSPKQYDSDFDDSRTKTPSPIPPPSNTTIETVPSVDNTKKKPTEERPASSISTDAHNEVETEEELRMISDDTTDVETEREASPPRVRADSDRSSVEEPRRYTAGGRHNSSSDDDE